MRPRRGTRRGPRAAAPSNTRQDDDDSDQYSYGEAARSDNEDFMSADEELPEIITRRDTSSSSRAPRPQPVPKGTGRASRASSSGKAKPAWQPPSSDDEQSSDVEEVQDVPLRSSRGPTRRSAGLRWQTTPAVSEDEEEEDVRPLKTRRMASGRAAAASTPAGRSSRGQGKAKQSAGPSTRSAKASAPHKRKASRLKSGRGAQKSKAKAGTQTRARSSARTSRRASRKSASGASYVFDPIVLPGDSAEEAESQEEFDGAFRPGKGQTKRKRKKFVPLYPSSDEDFEYGDYGLPLHQRRKAPPLPSKQKVKIQPHIDFEIDPLSEDALATYGKLRDVSPMPKKRSARLVGSDDSLLSDAADDSGVDAYLQDSSDLDDSDNVSVVSDELDKSTRAARHRRNSVEMLSDSSDGKSRRRRAKSEDSAEEHYHVSEDEEPKFDQDGLPIEKSLLGEHWPTCHKCGEESALSLMGGLQRLVGKLRREGKLRKGRLMERKTKGGRVSNLIGEFDETEAIEGTLEDRVEERRQGILQAGGWLECCTCSASFHWGCLAAPRQRRILDEINAIHEAAQKALEPGKPFVEREGLKWNEFVSFVECSDCFTEHGRRRCAHYECCRQVTGDSTVEETAVARQGAQWQCMDCEVWGRVASIIAWRPSAEAAAEPEPEPAPGEPLPVRSFKENLHREYLVRFVDVSFRNTQWVPHAWLSVTNSHLLNHFLQKGTRVELEDKAIKGVGKPIINAQSARAGVAGTLARGRKSAVELLSQAPATRRRRRRRRLELVEDQTNDQVAIVADGPPRAVPDAQLRIPFPWRTPDRVLDCFFKVDILGAAGRIAARNKEPPNPNRRPRAKQHAENRQKYREDPNMIHIDDLDENLLDPESALESLPYVAKIFVKWEDIGYDLSTWEDGPSPVDQADVYEEFVAAYRRYLQGRKVFVPLLSAKQLQDLDNRKGLSFKPFREQPRYVCEGQLLDFQLEGLNWMRFNWFNHQPGILADEMGLGKTIQMISFLGSLYHEYNVSPFLIVVPNSTIGNWVREFETWMPSMRVVPYYGVADSRDVVENYELFHENKMDGRQALKAHVVLVSDTMARATPAVLRRVQHWQVMVVDEGQSLKGGESNKLVRQLNDLPAEHRMIMTGTPLNNNIGELFNLLNWLQPGGDWSRIEDLKKEYESLTPALIEELQPRLRPFFLRRLKADVVNLPAKTELIVPISLKPVQKQIYKSILEANIEDIQGLLNERHGKGKKKKIVLNMNGILSQLRKCCQHPYLIAPTLEIREGDRKYVAEEEMNRFVDASGKLAFLRELLPKLKARGHRVLLFSQFVINLNIVEDFLEDAGYKFLRLDGNLGQKQRQKGIDAFNKPDSEYFIYILSTRAGGVGINLATADTVIVFDPDFNPHVDMQAIARAHRIGQTKRVLIFDLVSKSTAEERIIQNARGKMVLDHLIVQNLNNEETQAEEIESIIKYGAQALFAEQGTEETAQDIRYTSDDLDKLIERAETEDQDGPLAATEGDGGFSFARIWETENANGESDVVPAQNIADSDFWQDLLEKTRLAEDARREEKAKREAEELASGKRRTRKQTKYDLDGEQQDDDDEEWVAQRAGSEASDHAMPAAAEVAAEAGDLVPKPARKRGPRKSQGEGAARARGRPRKSQTDEATPGNQDGEAGPSQPKPRGRQVLMPDGENIPTPAQAQLILETIPRNVMIEVLDNVLVKKTDIEALQPSNKRPQLTHLHAVYFEKQLGIPYACFKFAFTFIDSSQLPENVRGLDFDGAVFLDAGIVREHLIRAVAKIWQVWNKGKHGRKARLLTDAEKQELMQGFSSLRDLGATNIDGVMHAAEIMFGTADVAQARSMLRVLRDKLVEMMTILGPFNDDQNRRLLATSRKVHSASEALLLATSPEAPPPLGNFDYIYRPRPSMTKAERELARQAATPPIDPMSAGVISLEQAHLLEKKRQELGPARLSQLQARARKSAGSASQSATSPSQTAHPVPRYDVALVPPPTSQMPVSAFSRPSTSQPPQYAQSQPALHNSPPRHPASSHASPPAVEDFYAKHATREESAPRASFAITNRGGQLCEICEGQFHFVNKCPVMQPGNEKIATQRYQAMARALVANPSNITKRTLTFMRQVLLKRDVVASQVPAV
ncbi:snf2 family dna-dependent atpase [Ceraceosorus bombacis]|uniref:Snf2 family dna-dependent atpase n=1 Tax=Ceraceosorus bombacis TaxID=401625 RepID=A0A0P1BIM8_9BASI|nr:snf2 family dna-dependent atpase [Ceraceosorus bombacis]